MKFSKYFLHCVILMLSSLSVITVHSIRLSHPVTLVSTRSTKIVINAHMH